MISASSPEFFELKYLAADDPWKFASNPYELERYRSILSALAGRRYRHAFEPGCSVGVLTEQLGSLCDAVEAIDFSATAVSKARTRCKGLPQVSIAVASVEEYLPAPSDLFVFAEVGYYFTPAKLELIVSRCLSCLAPSGMLLACHWLGHSADHVISGDAVHEVLGGLSELRLRSSQRFAHYQLDCWQKASEEMP